MRSARSEVDPSDVALNDGIEAAIRRESGLVIASLIRAFRDFDLAEEVFQEASLAAIEHWGSEGVPRKPGAWLLTAARRRAIDARRRQRTRLDAAASGAVAGRYYAEAEADLGSDADDSIQDERLRLIFTCCHPALPQDARIALTLRLLCGLSTRQVAAAFLVSESTMAKRLVRAKKKITEAGIPYRVPGADELPARLAAVLRVVYLVFNQGWSTPGEGGDLAEEAIRLGRALDALLPEEAEVEGLLSLMLLADARRDARCGDGVWVPLERQELARWDWEAIREGLSVLTRALDRGRLGAYQLQAAIAAKHAERAELGETPWGEIASLYDALCEIDPRPAVRMNAALAWARVEGPERALARLDAIEVDSPSGLDDHQPWHVARATLLAALGRSAESAAAYRRAVELAPGESERRFLERALARLEADL